MPVKPTPVEVRFWRFVTKRDGCWLWSGATHPAGYGVMGRGSRGTGLVRATHVSWKIHTGQDVPKGMIILHKCDNPPCVNPEHLQLGTHLDNRHDSKLKCRDSKPPVHRGLDNCNGILTDEQIKQLREDASGAPPRRHGRLMFWKSIGQKYGIQPKYAQQVATHRNGTR